MFKTESLAANILKITAPEKLSADDFKSLAPQVDAVIQQHGKIRLLIDATHLTGWSNIASFEAHLGFVKTHQHQAERVAIIIGHDWQRWIAAFAGAFLHPLIKTFTSAEEAAAAAWIASP